MQGFDLDMPLLELPGKDKMYQWTIRHAVEGVQIFGGIGSGKTSGSGRMIALKFLKARFGGLVLTAKPDEKALWQEYCRITNRTHDLIIVEPDGNHFFNFLEHESRKSDKGSSITENVVHVLKTVLKASEEKDTGKRDDAFWENALDMMIFNIIDLSKLAYGNVSVQNMYEIAQSIPRSKAELLESKGETAFHRALELAKRNVTEKLELWEKNLDVDKLNRMVENGSYESEARRSVSEFRLLQVVDEFFSNHFIGLNDKTRSIVEFSFSGFLFRFLRDPVFTLFCNTPSTFYPTDSLEGKIILINLPVKVYGKVGRDAQIMFKYIWQREMEKRTIHQNSQPVFLFADEAQNFLHEHDADYQATARSSRICTVYLSQNLPNYYANMGGEHSSHRVKSFLGTLNTKIFHSNADIETNQYASSLIGNAYFEKTSISDSIGVGNLSKSKSYSVASESIIPPERFSKLKTGGPGNKFKTETFIHRQGQLFNDGDNHLYVKFDQNYTPST